MDPVRFDLHDFSHVFQRLLRQEQSDFLNIFSSTQVLSKGQDIGILEDLQKQLRASVTTKASNLPHRSFRNCMTC